MCEILLASWIGVFARFLYSWFHAEFINSKNCIVYDLVRTFLLVNIRYLQCTVDTICRNMIFLFTQFFNSCFYFRQKSLLYRLYKYIITGSLHLIKLEPYIEIRTENY